MSGTMIGTYRVLDKLGAGGMGEVYRAHDDRLDRDVAVKILPESVRTDPVRLSGFRREARMLAALNHPNIAHIYGFEEPSDGAAFLVLELVDGPTLADRIAKGPIAVPDAIAIAMQMAAALEAAHDAGIIHRDLKPANVKLRPDGTVKVLDFGLAKALHAEPAATDSPALATFTATGSVAGLIVGTAAYMAPEQAKGRPVDRRADVWAFGVVLYEMLTGRRLFDGDDISEVLAAVLTRDPDWRDLPAATPAPLRRLLGRCLVKDPRARLDSMAAARLDLVDALAAPVAPESIGSRASPRRLVMQVMAGAVCVLAGALIVRWWRSPATEPQTSATPIVTALFADPAVVSAFTFGFAISPDAQTFVYAARGADGVRRLWRRRLAEADGQAISGTENAEYPFWSPDSQTVAFFADGALKRVPATGGVVQKIADAPGTWPRGTWAASGTILFSLDGIEGSGIRRVEASGGPSTRLPLEGAVSDPQWLPDGRHFLFVRHLPDPPQLMSAAIDGSDPPVTIMALARRGGEAAARFSPAGFLLFEQGDALAIQRFDATARRLDGRVSVVARRAGTPRGWFAVCVSGTTVAALNPESAPGTTPGDPIIRLEWVDRHGRRLGQLGDAARYWTLSLSPDGTSAAVNPGYDIWTINGVTGVSGRVVTGSGALWLPNGRELLYRDDRGLGVIRADGGGVPRRILEFADRTLVPTSVTADGRFVTVTERVGGRAKSTDLAILTLADGTVTPWLTTDADESEAAFSPDGRFIAYVSNQTGRPEVYVRALAEDAPVARLSTEGGEHPSWRRDGKELVFISPVDDMMSVDMSTYEQTGRPGTPSRLFHLVMSDVIRDWFAPYAMTGDGQRFLVQVADRPEPLSWIMHADAYLEAPR